MQDGAGEVDAGEPEELQSRRRGEPTHDPGVPAVVVGDLTDVRQRGDVEPAVGAVGAALLGRQLYISMLSPESHLFLRRPSLFLPSLPPQPAIPAISLPSLAACTKSHRRSPAAPAFCSQPLPPATATATLVSSSKKIAAAALTNHGRCLLPSLPADHTPLRPLLQRRPPHLPPLLPRRTPLLSRCCSPRRTPLPPLPSRFCRSQALLHCSQALLCLFFPRSPLPPSATSIPLLPATAVGHLYSSPPCHRRRPSLLLHNFPSASHPIFPCDPRKPPPPLLLPCLSSLLPLPRLHMRSAAAAHSRTATSPPLQLPDLPLPNLFSAAAAITGHNCCLLLCRCCLPALNRVTVAHSSSPSCDLRLQPSSLAAAIASSHSPPFSHLLPSATTASIAATLILLLPPSQVPAAASIFLSSALLVYIDNLVATKSYHIYDANSCP
ncbi:hypothetical protein BHM03_00011451 [Ensete ventricosum]|nr:hypothetical protein BHM03_00011451 [Ensete ventricosum]